MARRTGGAGASTVTLPPVDETLLASDEATEQRIRDEELLYAELGQAPEDAVAHVYIVQGDGREPKIWRGPPTSLDLEALSKKFGSGDYRVMLYARVQGGQLVRKMNKVVPQLVSAEEDARIKAARSGELSAAAPSTPAGFSLTDLTAAIRAAIPAPLPPPDPLAMIEKLGTAMRAMMPPPAPVVPPAPHEKPMGFMEMLTAFKTFREVARDMVPAGGGDGDSGMLREGISLVRDLAARSPVAAPAGAVALPAAEPAPAGSAAANDESEDALLFKLQMKQACKAAAANVPAAEYADDIFPFVPVDLLKMLASTPEWFAALVKAFPDAANFQPWFTTLRDELVKIAGEEGLLTGTENLNSLSGASTQGATGGTPSKAG